MSLARINYNPLMTQHIVATLVFKNSPFYLIDVGASGGIEAHWKVFDKYLCAFGFEPLINECNKLNNTANDNKITYMPYFVGTNDESITKLAISNLIRARKFYGRSSSRRYINQNQINYVKEKFNSGAEVKYSDEKITLDDFISKISPTETIDFIKIDTDGHDYEVIHGAQEMLSKKEVLGLTIEVQFHGLVDNHSNVFRNIDRLLSENGFSLFDLDVYRYTKKDLPGKFCYVIPAQTETGQITFGEALYLRDYSNPTSVNSCGFNLSPIKIVKLACLLELFGMPDCAVELINYHEEILKEVIDVKNCLDLLAANVGIAKSYAEHNQFFETTPEKFFPES